MLANKAYLGDGVYVENKHGLIKMSTKNGINTNNVIFLEFKTVDKFFRYVKSITENNNDTQNQNVDLEIQI